VAQQSRGAPDAALRSYERARGRDPDHRDAPLNEALLLAKRATPEAVRRARGLLKAALGVDPRSPGAWWNLGLLEAYEGDPAANHTLDKALDAVQQLGWSPRRLAMVYESSFFNPQLAAESDHFEACAPEPLAAALAAFRRLPGEAQWLKTWGVETVDTFGPDTTAAAYGETFYDSWKAVMDQPAVSAVLRTNATAVVLGSALGYLCLFFLAIDVPCTGFDLLEESMVQTGREVLSQHGLAEAPLDFQVGDAADCPLISRFHTATSPSILWLNDEVWPRELRDHVKARAGWELPLGSVVVSYGPQGRSVPGLELAGSLRAATSWCRAEEFHLWKRI